MKRLMQLNTPTKLASGDTEYSVIAGDCDFIGGELVFQTPYGELTVQEVHQGPFLNLPEGFDLAQFSASRPDVLVVN